MFCCPNCKQPLTRLEHVYRCENGHCFDIASGGYVNLLLANQKSSKNPGDNPTMIGARTYFLNSGSYSCLSDHLNHTIDSLCSANSSVILDAGCGEGYYAQRLYQQLTNLGKSVQIFGIDLSKNGVKSASKRCSSGYFAVASLFGLPFADNTIDLVYNVFSPLCPTEFFRVLKPDGYFVAVYPAARHLFGLKEVLYENPYENAEKSFELDGFQITDKKRVSYTMDLSSQQTIYSLYTMTPYFYKTPLSGAERLAKLEYLQTEADFWIITYEKTAG